MSKYYQIKSKLSGNVIDIEGASTADGALLDAYTLKTSGNDNQLWEFVPDPNGSGYYFIKSKLNGNVIDIQNSGGKDGTPLDAVPQQTAANNTASQLWQFVEDPSGSGYCFIMSQLNGNVIEIQNASKTPGAALESYPVKFRSTDNELWEVVGGSFPATVSMVAYSSLGSNSNYLMYGECNPLVGMFVQIEITQNMVCESVAAGTGPCNGGAGTFGFSFQLNCYSAKGQTCAYQQYVVAFWRNSSGGFDVIYGVDNWPVSGPNLMNNNLPKMATLSSEILPAGYQILISLVGSSTTPKNVESVVFSLIDNNGNTVGSAAVDLTTVSGYQTGDLAPITACELNIVGPINGESAVLSSGGGFITYGVVEPAGSVFKVFVPTTAKPRPSCTETTVITCEAANTFYGLLPSSSNLFFKQSFEVNKAKAMIVKSGKMRPSTRYVEK